MQLGYIYLLRSGPWKSQYSTSSVCSDVEFLAPADLIIIRHTWIICESYSINQSFVATQLYIDLLLSVIQTSIILSVLSSYHFSHVTTHLFKVAFGVYSSVNSRKPCWLHKYVFRTWKFNLNIKYIFTSLIISNIIC